MEQKQNKLIMYFIIVFYFPLQACVERNLVQGLDAIDNNDAHLLTLTVVSMFKGVACISNTDYHIKAKLTNYVVVHLPSHVFETQHLRAELNKMEELDVIEKRIYRLSM